jgi:hypothetical protein
MSIKTSFLIPMDENIPLFIKKPKINGLMTYSSYLIILNKKNFLLKKIFFEFTLIIMLKKVFLLLEEFFNDNNYHLQLNINNCTQKLSKIAGIINSALLFIQFIELMIIGKKIHQYDSIIK